MLEVRSSFAYFLLSLPLLSRMLTVPLTYRSSHHRKTRRASSCNVGRFSLKPSGFARRRRVRFTFSSRSRLPSFAEPLCRLARRSESTPCRLLERGWLSAASAGRRRSIGRRFLPAREEKERSFSRGTRRQTVSSETLISTGSSEGGSSSRASSFCWVKLAGDNVGRPFFLSFSPLLSLVTRSYLHYCTHSTFRHSPLPPTRSPFTPFASPASSAVSSPLDE